MSTGRHPGPMPSGSPTSSATPGLRRLAASALRVLAFVAGLALSALPAAAQGNASGPTAHGTGPALAAGLVVAAGAIILLMVYAITLARRP